MQICFPIIKVDYDQLILMLTNSKNQNMGSSITNLFGGILAVLLFLLYAGILGFMITKVFINNGAAVEFADGLIYVVTTIGGLVSALVISKLAITRPGTDPAQMKISEKVDSQLNKRATFIAYIYLAGWVLLGLSSLLTGVVFYPEANKTISDIGTTWLGLSVAAGYSYFGIQNNNGSS